MFQMKHLLSHAPACRERANSRTSETTLFDRGEQRSETPTGFAKAVFESNQMEDMPSGTTFDTHQMEDMPSITVPPQPLRDLDG
jgi:hypothetical protein